MRLRIAFLIGCLSGLAQADSGCLVSMVRPGSAAETAGLQDGDVILEAGGKQVLGIDDLQAIVGEADKDLSIKYLRLGQTETVTVRLGSGKREPRLGVQCAATSSEPAALAPAVPMVTAPATPKVQRTPTGPLDAFFMGVSAREKVTLTMKDGRSIHGAFDGFAQDGVSVKLTVRSGMFQFRKTYLFDNMQDAKRN